ncbi:MAG: hypothetical protein WCS31_06150 [Verrucomicrobiae bacterium]
MPTPHTPALIAARTVLAGLMHHRKTPQAGPIVEALDAVKTVVASLSICLKTDAAKTLANCGDPEISALAKESFEIARDYANTALLLWPVTAPAARRAPQQRTACDPARRARLAALTSQYNQIYK